MIEPILITEVSLPPGHPSRRADSCLRIHRLAPGWSRPGGHGSRDTVSVIAAQALYDPPELEAEESTEPLSQEEAEVTSDSARAIKSLRPMAVHFSHDPGIWAG
ncbi:MAG TPA: hypothetical protein VMP13_00200 [Acidimicrobiia bacterium]|nr:hypothetical protein [Acidimicrobiia bacterium]